MCGESLRRSLPSRRCDAHARHGVQHEILDEDVDELLVSFGTRFVASDWNAM